MADLVERVAKAIAEEGFGRKWPDDFHEIWARDTDRSDIRDYARAAIGVVLEEAAKVAEQRAKQLSENTWSFSKEYCFDEIVAALRSMKEQEDG